MTAIQEAVPAAAGAAQSRGGEVSNAAAAITPEILRKLVEGLR